MRSTQPNSGPELGHAETHASNVDFAVGAPHTADPCLPRRTALAARDRFDRAAGVGAAIASVATNHSSAGVDPARVVCRERAGQRVLGRRESLATFRSVIDRCTSPAWLTRACVAMGRARRPAKRRAMSATRARFGAVRQPRLMSRAGQAIREPSATQKTQRTWQLPSPAAGEGAPTSAGTAWPPR